MPLKIDDYRCELINKLLFANSQEDAQTFIYAAVKELKEHEVHNYIIKRFIDKTVESLNGFNSSDYNSQQWTNIKMSKIALNRFKTSISQVVSGDSNIKIK